MVRTGMALLMVALAAASGCKSDSGGGAAPAAADPFADRKIQAVEPHDMTQEAGRKPIFRWKLPAILHSPNIVTFKLFEIGLVEDPRKGVEQARQIAPVTGLAGASPTEVDPFKPLAPAVITGEILDLKQLAPNTWYCWKIRALSDLGAGDAIFFFRTRPDDAAPGATP